MLAEELVDCWIIAKFNYADMLKPFETRPLKRKALQTTYDQLMDGLIEYADSMPPALRLHSLTRKTMIVLNGNVK